MGLNTQQILIIGGGIAAAAYWYSKASKKTNISGSATTAGGAAAGGLIDGNFSLGLNVPNDTGWGLENYAANLNNLGNLQPGTPAAGGGSMGAAWGGSSAPATAGTGSAAAGGIVDNWHAQTPAEKGWGLESDSLPPSNITQSKPFDVAFFSAHLGI